MANWAWVVGVNQYQRLRPLECAVADAQAMQAYLSESEFDQIFYFADDSPAIRAPDGSWQETRPTYANLWSFLVDFFAEPCLGDGDNFWFFFSGHGVRHQSRDHLMPCDGNPRAIDRTTIPLHFVTERLRQVGADNVVLFLDACRDEDKAGLGIGGEVQRGVVQISSCAPSEKSYEIEALGQGAFTYALLEALQIQGERNCATVERLCNHLRYRVPQLNQQHGKPLQTPYEKVEPGSKYHLVLLPERANQADWGKLRECALEAEADGDLLLAKQLWRRVVIADPLNARAFDRYERVVAKLAAQLHQTPPAPAPPPASSAGSKATAPKAQTSAAPPSPPPPPEPEPTPEPTSPLDAVEFAVRITRLLGEVRIQKFEVRIWT